MAYCWMKSTAQTAERNEAMNKALTAAEYGDYSFLQDMGIDTSGNPSDWERQYTLALLAAEYGDFSGLQALASIRMQQGWRVSTTR